MKKLLAAFLAALVLAATAQAQTWPTPTRSGKFAVRSAPAITSVTTLVAASVDDTAANLDVLLYTQTRTYLIDHIEGPDSDGVVRIVGKDPLRYTDDDKYQVPAPSKGVLSTALAIDAATLGLAAPGIGDTYPSSGVLRVDDELIAYASKSGDLLQGLTRGYLGTTAAEHDASTTVQVCTTYTAETVPNILYDLLVNYAGRDPSFITLSDWTAEADTWLAGFNSTVVLPEPSSVRDVVKEVLQASGSSLWWDEEAAQIRFKVIMPFLIKADVVQLNDTAHILQDTTTIEDEEDQRVSRVATYYNLIDPVGDVDKKNFKTLLFQVDTDSEGASAYGTPQALEILSRWTLSDPYAAAIGNRMLYRRRETPRQVTVQLDAKDAIIKIGDLRDLQSRLMQDLEGSTSLTRCIVTQVREVEPGTTFEYTLLQISSQGGKRAALFAPNTTNDWTAATPVEKKNYLYFTDANGLMSDGSKGPTLC